jgi:hypothetical protein
VSPVGRLLASVRPRSRATARYFADAGTIAGRQAALTDLMAFARRAPFRMMVARSVGSRNRSARSRAAAAAGGVPGRVPPAPYRPVLGDHLALRAMYWESFIGGGLVHLVSQSIGIGQVLQHLNINRCMAAAECAPCATPGPISRNTALTEFTTTARRSASSRARMQRGSWQCAAGRSRRLDVGHGIKPPSGSHGAHGSQKCARGTHYRPVAYCGALDAIRPRKAGQLTALRSKVKSPRLTGLM